MSFQVDKHKSCSNLNLLWRTSTSQSTRKIFDVENLQTVTTVVYNILYATMYKLIIQKKLCKIGKVRLINSIQNPVFIWVVPWKCIFPWWILNSGIKTSTSAVHLSRIKPLLVQTESHSIKCRNEINKVYFLKHFGNIHVYILLLFPHCHRVPPGTGPAADLEDRACFKVILI